tara:strand:- start:185 stop:706 length:522 start_codon:yes stop_codon:yes gene_type:complete
MIQLKLFKRDPKNWENSLMGCLASTTTVCIMIPMDTIKTRLVTQLSCPDLVPYKGMVDCGKRVFAEEGAVAFYRGLPPRLLSVVPMIGIQFGVYEFMKKFMLATGDAELTTSGRRKWERQLKGVVGGGGGGGGGRGGEGESKMIQNAMQVAADDDQPNAAPFIKRRPQKKKNK